MNNLLLFIASVVVWRAYQPYFQELGVPVVWFGVFYFLLHVMTFLLKWHADHIEKRFDTTKLLAFTAASSIIVLVAVTYIQIPWFVFIGLLIFFGLANVRRPLFAHAINKRISSRSRATTLSNLNVLKSIMDIPIWFLAAYVSQFEVEYCIFNRSGVGIYCIGFFLNSKEGFSCSGSATGFTYSIKQKIASRAVFCLSSHDMNECSFLERSVEVRNLFLLKFQNSFSSCVKCVI